MAKRKQYMNSVWDAKNTAILKLRLAQLLTNKAVTKGSDGLKVNKLSKLQLNYIYY